MKITRKAFRGIVALALNDLDRPERGKIEDRAEDIKRVVVHAWIMPDKRCGCLIGSLFLDDPDVLKNYDPQLAVENRLDDQTRAAGIKFDELLQAYLLGRYDERPLSRCVIDVED